MGGVSAGTRRKAHRKSETNLADYIAELVIEACGGDLNRALDLSLAQLKMLSAASNRIKAREALTLLNCLVSSQTGWKNAASTVKKLESSLERQANKY